MKEDIVVYFIGTAGSGKSTLTNTMKEWMTLRGLNAITVNLDPGAENLPYEPDVDIRDWISLQEVMETHGLGPNGAQIACADMLALNTADVKNSIDMFKSDYILVDTPGQLELFVFGLEFRFLLDGGGFALGFLLDPLGQTLGVVHAPPGKLPVQQITEHDPARQHHQYQDGHDDRCCSHGLQPPFISAAEPLWVRRS